MKNEPKVGDIIVYRIHNFDEYYGIVVNVWAEREIVRINWFNPAVKEKLGETISFWEYGSIWEKAS